MPSKPVRPQKAAEGKKGKTIKAKSRKDELLGLLAKTAKSLDDEGLEFILNQAHVLLYNKQVDRLSAQLRKAKSAVRGAGKKGKSGESIPGDMLPRPGEVEIVEKESGNFFIVVNNFRIIFSREEMRSLVKICHASADAGDASNRLFIWFERNRKDLLIDGGIVSRTHPALESIYLLLISRYKVKSAD